MGSHNNKTLIPHAPAAPLTYRDPNTDNLLTEKPANMNIDEPAIDKNILTERPAPSQNIDKQATETETADKPANIDKPASVNETVEKTTENGPTHNGNRTASDNIATATRTKLLSPHAPAALQEAGTTLAGDINRHGISEGLQKIALSPEDLNRGRRYRDVKMWEASADALSVERILSAESYACLFRQLTYYFTLDHLGSNTHASERHRRDGGFTIRDLMSWNRMQGVTLKELTEFIHEVPGLYYRSSKEDDYMNVNWDEVDESCSSWSDDLNEMSDDDKKKYLLKNADQHELNEIYWEDPITIWDEEKLLDFIVFSRQLVNSEGYDSDGASGIGFASL